MKQPGPAASKPIQPASLTIEEIFNLTKSNRWFLVQIKESAGFEEELAGARN